MMQRFLFLMVLIASISASAAQIRVDNPSCNDPKFANDPVTNVYNLNNGFSFEVTPQTGGQPVFYFCNKTDEAWTSLLLAIHTSLSPSDVNCATSGAAVGTPAFQYCSITNPENGLLYANFTNTSPFNSPNNFDNKHKNKGDDDGEGGDDNKYPGVGIGDIFIIDLTCINKRSPACQVPNWNPGDGGNGYANYDPSNGYPVPSPEPATLALVASGIAVTAMRRKRR